MKKIKKDWRLPIIKELFTLIEMDYDKLKAGCNIFDNEDYFYLSSTIDKNNSEYILDINFEDCHIGCNHKDSASYVRLVRVSKKGYLQWSASSKNMMDYNEAVKYAKGYKGEVVYKSKIKAKELKDQL